MKQIIVALAVLSQSYAIAQQLEPVGIFEHHQDVGSPKLKGSFVYNEADQTYIMTGAGANMWEANDQFHFAWKRIKGDFMMRATVQFINTGTVDHRKIGIIARDQLTADSRYADGAVHGDIMTSLQYRESDGAKTDHIILSSFHPTEIELERVGNTITFSAAPFGENYKSVTKEIALNEEIYLGLFICSHSEDVVEKAIFSNVQIIIPPAKDYRPYRDYLGSHIEVMEVATGRRKIIHSAPNSLQAPNWTPDNEYLIYNAEGLLYRYDLKTGNIDKLNTGTATSNNNDHVLSFDGKWLAISDQSDSASRNQSVVYVVPTEGGTPRRITPLFPSYLHGWSPDGKHLVYTGIRGSAIDIYTIPVTGGTERALTQNQAMNDGPEYAADGRIYFNSTRSGKMQIWRMNGDGSAPQQLTNDQFNNWFPHVSPDGKSLVYIAFPPDIDPKDHPWYKHVYLRSMSVNGGPSKVLAYLYGGQGTINVPSWSPDSRMLAFVSNTGTY